MRSLSHVFLLEFAVDLPYLTSLMGTLTVVATYYWAGRPEPAAAKKALWGIASAPIRVYPPYWSNEWI